MILDEAAVRDLLDIDELIAVVERGLIEFSSGRVVQPVRSMIPVAEHGGFLGVMPAYAGVLGVKLVTFFPNNRSNNRDVHTHHAVIQLFKAETGEPLVTMDGRLITEERTAAASAVATKHLARTEARVLALLGAGVQARSHLKALRLVRPLDEVRVWSPRSAAVFAREHGVIAAASAEEAVRGADVVVVATNSRTPVLLGEWLAPGAHVNAVGACIPDWRELDDDVLRRSRMFVDSRAAALVESGDAIAAPAIVAEIGEVAAGTDPGRRSTDEITVFKSLGLAVEDIVSAELVYRKASC
jgi:ornithine cyclodeaminase/alanine dehydrogenase-like protein (mu-crystallin family)